MDKTINLFDKIHHHQTTTLYSMPTTYQHEEEKKTFCSKVTELTATPEQALVTHGFANQSFSFTMAFCFCISFYYLILDAADSKPLNVWQVITCSDVTFTLIRKMHMYCREFCCNFGTYKLLVIDMILSGLRVLMHGGLLLCFALEYIPLDGIGVFWSSTYVLTVMVAVYLIKNRNNANNGNQTIHIDNRGNLNV